MAQDDRAALGAWARATRVPLLVSASGAFEDISGVARLIANARLVALGEGAHGLIELLEFRNRLLQFLVEEHGFSAIAIESGLVESRIVHEYVQGGDGDVATVVANGLSWGFDQFPQNRALISWLRDYNASSCRARKIQFYGFDVSGSPGMSTVLRGLETSLIDSLNYLSRMDREAAATYRARIAPFLPYLRFDYYARLEGPGYDRLSGGERDALSAIVSDLIASLEARQLELTELSSADEFDWAHRAATGARQIDTWMRQIPQGWEASLAQIERLDRASDLRDRAQAENIGWIAEREGSNARVLIFGHNAHLSNAYVNRVWWPCESTELPAQKVEHRQVPAGSHLKRRYGKHLVTIGHLVRDQRIPSIGIDSSRERGSLCEPIDEALADKGSPSFLIDVRTVPKPVACILDQDARLGPSFELPGKFRGFMTVPLRQAFDALLYLNATGVS